MISTLSWLNLLYLWKIFECTSRKLRKEISTLFISIDDESHNFAFWYINTDSIEKRFCQFNWSLRSRFLDIIFVNSFSLRWLINLFLTRRFCREKLVTYHIILYLLLISTYSSDSKIKYLVYHIIHLLSYFAQINIYIYTRFFHIIRKKDHHVEEKYNESVRRNALIESLWFKSCSMYNISQIIIMSQWIWKWFSFLNMIPIFFRVWKNISISSEVFESLLWYIDFYLKECCYERFKFSTRKWWDS